MICSAYWGLTAEVTCPRCGRTFEEELQTHWMGEIGSCLNHYKLGQPVDELRGIEAATLNGTNDQFDAMCAHCPKAERRFSACIYCDGTNVIQQDGLPVHTKAGDTCVRHPHDAEHEGKFGHWYEINWFGVGARIENGAVVAVWTLPVSEGVKHDHDV